MSIATEIQRLQSAKADIKSAIEQKGVTVGDGTIDTYAEKIAEISGGGVEFDRYIKGSPQFTTLNMFKTSEAVLNLDNATSLVSLFNVSGEVDKNTTVEHLTINTKNAVAGINQMFQCPTNAVDMKLKHITFNTIFDSCARTNNAFTNLRALEIIDGTPFNLSATTLMSNMFSYCNELKEVRFVENSISMSITFQWCDKLSTDTIQSIIDGLATVDTAQTLTLHNDVKILQSQVDSANAKGWTVAGGTVVSEEEYYG